MPKSPPTRQQKWRTFRARFVAVGLGWLVFRALCAIVPHARLADRFPTSTAVYDTHGKLLRLVLAGDEQYRLWVPMAEISPNLVEATLLYEDKHYYHHGGFNPVSLFRAVTSTYGGGRRIGGSTVTMQLARRLYHLESRSVAGKLMQILRAMQLEAVYSKDEILEAYLNTVPYGGNIEGVGGASLIYFGKPSRSLTLPEALTLAVIPQNPTKRGAFGPALLEARGELFGQWMAKHAEAKRDEALMKLPIQLRTVDELPFLAPHFVDSLMAARKNEPQTPSRPQDSQVRSTLDLSLQRLVERHTRAYVSSRQRIGIHNAAVMLVDTRTMSVRAELGSVDWRDAEIAGQVNGTEAKRSPGSTLKPFVYALGLEQGVITPATMLRDVPVTFGAYSPENFDGRFAGPLSAKDALIRSRNIPALSVAGKLNKPSFYEFLRQSGVSKLGPEGHYGLGIVLGGAEVTMEELVTLYAALANKGMLRPLHTTERPVGPASDDGARILSEDASWLVLDMLADNPRPDRARGAEGNHLPVSWKTGTSWGFRDAWTVGVFGPYVLAVWVGNFSGEGNPSFVGIGAAAPLFFEIVDSIVAADPGLEAPRWPVPPKLRRVSVCAVSGQLPGANCHHQKTSWFLPGRSAITPCEIHRAVTLEDATGLRACATTTGPTHVEVFEDWSSDMQQLFAEAHLPRRAIPEPAAGCGNSELGLSQNGVPPRITSPLRGVTYALKDGGNRVALTSVTGGDAHEVFWFVGKEFIGKAKSGTPLFFTPRPGSYVVRAVDDHGRVDSRELRVE